MVIIKSLDEVSNLKSGRQHGKFSPAALCAVLFGQRLATPDYLHALMALDSKQFLLKKEASASSPSIKFDSVACRRPLRVCVEDCFKTAHRNTWQMLVAAVALQGTQWKLIDVEVVRALQAEPKFKALPKDILYLATPSSNDLVHNLCREHAMVDETRSSFGRFKQVRT